MGDELQEDYWEFILDLLQAEIEGGSQAVFPVLRANRNLLDSNFSQVLENVVNYLLKEPPEAKDDIIALVENIIIRIQEFPLGSRAAKQEIAIAGYEIVLNHRQPESEDWALTQNNLGEAYRNRINGSRAENLERAIEYYQAALTVRTREDFPEKWAMTQNNLAIAYSDRINGSRAENLERAIEYSQAALTVLNRKDFPEYWAETQNNLAVAYKERIKGSHADNLERAIEYYQAALAVAVYKLEDFPESWAIIQNNIGEAYRARINGSRAENLELAIKYYQAALTVSKLEDFPEDWAMIQNNLANAYYQRINGSRAENLELAIKYYQAALTVYKLEDFPIDNVKTLSNLGETYLAKLNCIDQQTPVDADQKRTNPLAWLKSFLSKKVKPVDTDQRVATINSAYATFRDAITGADYLRRLESLKEVKEKHDVQFDRLYIGIVQVCVELGRNQEALVYAETNKARNLGELLAQRKENPQPLEPITYGQITQLLRTPTTALIEWYITDSEIFTFVLTVQGLQVHRSRNVQELEDLVAAYQADYKERSSWSARLPIHLQNLGEILGLAPLLPPDCDQLILIPHWYLHLFPLHALPLKETECLIDRFPQGIQYAPSCQLLHQITPQANFAQLLALQNPTGDLTYTNLEVDSIAPKFPTSKVLPGAEASKTNLLEQYLDQLQSAHCAHFSCHGFFDPESPLKSALILSGGILDDEDVSDIAQETQEDGTGTERYVAWRKGKKADITKCLTLGDIFTLQLNHCRLAVLSACETALIDTTNRSDYIGLPTGFLHAGATGVLASLWAVEDISTALMMVRFYEEFFAASSPSLSLALHKTQLWFKSATTPDLRTWVEKSDSFNTSQKKIIFKQLGGYRPDTKPYGKVHQWAAFCAIGL